MKMKIRCEYTRLVPIAQLVPHPKNPKVHSEEAIERQALVLEYQGWRRPITVSNRSGVMTAGHKRLLAAKLRGEKEVPVSFQDYESEEQEIADLIADNALNEWELTDLDRVKSLAMDLPVGFNVDLLGLKDFEIAPIDSAGGGDDAAPEPPKVALTKLGELWLLGEHRLLCGDSTKREDVERVMGGARAVLMNTDPPYGVSYTSTALSQEDGKWEEIENDNLRDEELQAFLTAVFKNAADVALVDNAAWYLWHAHLTQGFFAAAAAAAAAEVILHRQIIWVKQQLILGRGMYHWKHEPCFMGWREGHRPEWYGDRCQTTTWDLGPRELDRVHPTQKPVLLFELPISHHTKAGEWVYEPFSGSGSQFIAAEKLGRRCAGLELAPAYVDVILDRWAKYTGKDPVREDGVTWKQLKDGGG